MSTEAERRSAAPVLRPVQATDVAVFFEQQSDPDAAHMAAFTVNDPGDPDLFAQQWRTIFVNDAITSFTVQHQGAVAGYVLAYPWAGTLEVSYWLGRRFWGQGIATEALLQLLTVVVADPLPRMLRTTMWGRCERWRSAALR